MGDDDYNYDKEYVVRYDDNNKKVTKYIDIYDFQKGDIVDSTITSTNKKVNIEIGVVTEKK